MGVSVNIYRFSAGLDYWGWVRWVDEDYGELQLQFGKNAVNAIWPTPILIRALNPEDDPKQQLGDCPHHTYGNVLVFSRRAIDDLRDLLNPEDEVLPLDSQLGEFYAVNILKKIDCLDVSNSEVWRFPSSGRIGRVDRFAFHEDRVAADIFRIHELTGECFVTQRFVDRIMKAKLEGFRIKQVWPQAAPAVDIGGSVNS